MSILEFVSCVRDGVDPLKAKYSVLVSSSSSAPSRNPTWNRHLGAPTCRNHFLFLFFSSQENVSGWVGRGGGGHCFYLRLGGDKQLAKWSVSKLDTYASAADVSGDIESLGWKSSGIVRLLRNGRCWVFVSADTLTSQPWTTLGFTFEYVIAAGCETNSVESFFLFQMLNDNNDRLPRQIEAIVVSWYLRSFYNSHEDSN